MIRDIYKLDIFFFVHIYFTNRVDNSLKILYNIIVNK